MLEFNTIKLKNFILLQIFLVVLFIVSNLAGLFIGHKLWFVAIPKELLTLSVTLYVWFAYKDLFSKRMKDF